MGAAKPYGGDSMHRFLPPITCVFVGVVATLVSSCARDCVAPEAAYAARPPAGSGPGIQQYALPPPAPQYGSPPGAYPYGASPGTPPYGPPPTGQYGPPPGAS
jgi:hypothetical protein